MPIREAIGLINEVYNSSFENGTANGFSSNWNYDSVGSITYPNDGGSPGSYYCRFTYTVATTGGLRGWYMRQLANTGAETYTISMYVRPSMTLNATMTLEQNVGGTQYQSNFNCPANVWTRVYWTVTANASATLVRPCFYVVGPAATIGTTIDTDGYMVTRTTFLTGYRDGASTGWQWTGTQYTSTQTGPYFVDKPLKTRSKIVNEITNPRLAGSGTVANNFFVYENSGGTGVGSRSVSGGAQTINLTSINGGLNRYGVSTSTAVTLDLPIRAGKTIRAGYTADMTNASGLRASVLVILYYSDGTNTSAAPANSNTTGSTAGLSVSLTITPPKDVIRYTFYMYISSVGAFSGSATIICTSPYLIADPITGSPSGYFDGSSGVVGSIGIAEWAGTVDNSVSVIPYWETDPTNVNATINKVFNPNFVGSGSSATGWGSYTSGTAVGTRLFGGNTLTLTATSLLTSGGQRRFGVNVPSSTSVNGNTKVFIPAGSIIYMSAKVDTTALDPSTQAFIYSEARREDVSVRQYMESSSIVGGRVVSSYTVPEDIYYNSYFIIGIKSNVDWTGTSTVIFSEALWTHLKPSESPPAWFTGDTAGAKWLGTADNSMSMLPGWRNALT